MNALVAQWSPQWLMLFPESSWKKSDFRQHGSHCEQETLKVVSSIQSSNLEKSNFNFMQLSPRSKWDLPRPQHLWNTVLFPLEDKHQLLPFGLHPADTLGNWQDLNDLLGCFIWKLFITSRLREDHPFLGIRFRIRQLTLIVGSTSVLTLSIWNSLPSLFKPNCFPSLGDALNSPTSEIKIKTILNLTPNTPALSRNYDIKQRCIISTK